MLNPINQKVKRTRPVVQHIPVKLSSGDDDLQRVSEGMIHDDERREDEEQRASAEGGNRLHRHYKRVRSEIAQIRHGVLARRCWEHGSEANFRA